MSAFCGLIRFDGAPATAEDLAAMCASIRHWGADGGGTWLDGSAGLAQLVAHRTSESLYERGPVRRGDFVLTAAARLDNRDELLALFGDGNDSELIAGAYEKWGEDAPLHLLGDWAFAAWHPRDRRLFLARDHFGNTAMHYYAGERLFAFGSGTKALFALRDVPRRLDELRLSQFLSMWTVDGTSTIHENIRRLPPACTVTVRDGRVQVRQYWTLDDAPDIGLRSDDAIIQRFRELYEQAVRVRLRSRGAVASQLSAGLDSGAVSAIAARALRPEGKRLTAFTSVPRFEREAAADLPDNNIVNEWTDAHRTAEWAGNIEHVAIAAEDITPLQGIDRYLEQHGEPELGAPNWYWNFAMFDEVRRRDCSVLLTGQMGNLGPSWPGPPYTVWRALGSGRVASAWRVIREWRRQSRQSWSRTLLHTVAGPVRHRMSTALLKMRGIPFDAGTLIQPAFAARLDLRRRAQESGWLTKLATGSPTELRFGVFAPGISPTGALWHDLAANAGFDARDPTTDVRLIAFSYRVPERLFSRPEGDRWLMRTAMEGTMPPDVLWTVRRGRQSADLAYRLRADAAATSAAVEAIARSPRCNEVLNVGQIREWWQAISDPSEMHPSAAAFPFTSALMIGRFVASLDR